MSAPFPGPSRSTRLDASQGIGVLPSSPFGAAQQTGYPSLYPFPEACQPPFTFTFPHSAIPWGIPPFTFGVYGPNHASALQGHGNTALPDFTPMINDDVWTLPYPFDAALVQHATTSATAFPPSWGSGHQGRTAASLTFQPTFPVQPWAAPNGMQNLHHLPIAQQNSFSKCSLGEPKQVHGDQTSSGGHASGKQGRSENDLEDRPRKLQRAKRGDAPKTRKKRKRPEGVEFACRFCEILGKGCKPLSRKDALKRHIELLHKLFLMLLAHVELDILEPRRIGQLEDLTCLIEACVRLQIQAQRRGMVIEPEQDLTVLYPHIAAAAAAVVSLNDN